MNKDDYIKRNEYEIVERKRGEWIKENGRKDSVTWWYSCNQCGSAGNKTDKFCKNCGAKMEVSE